MEYVNFDDIPIWTEKEYMNQDNQGEDGKEYEKEYLKEYKKQYNQQEDVRRKKNKYQNREDVKKRKKEYMKEYRKEYYQREDVKEKLKRKRKVLAERIKCPTCHKQLTRGALYLHNKYLHKDS